MYGKFKNILATIFKQINKYVFKKMTKSWRRKTKNILEENN